MNDCASTYQLAQTALNGGTSLEKCVAARLSDERLDLEELQTWNRLLPPIDHPDVAHLYLTGTGKATCSRSKRRRSGCRCEIP